MRRLYSNFAGGWPGIGLMLMRLVVAIALVNSAGAVLLGKASAPVLLLSALLAGAAVLLIIGLYTPIVGALVAIIEACRLLAMPAGRLVYLLVATVGAALAMLGPGLWSIDAHLFGWKRIEPSPRKK